MMKNEDFKNQYGQLEYNRYQKTISFLEKNISKNENILDLGVANPLAKFMIHSGYQVKNTPDNIDLDDDYHFLSNTNAQVVTAFEIFEHLVSPYPLLKIIDAPKLIASVPLNLWFSAPHWSKKDPYDRHFHEFYPQQFDMLLDKAGWKIINSEKWAGDTRKFGIRPLLRKFVPRFYIVYCERK